MIYKAIHTKPKDRTTRTLLKKNSVVEKRIKGQAMISKTPQRKLTIEQHEPHCKQEVELRYPGRVNSFCSNM